MAGANLRSMISPIGNASQEGRFLGGFWCYKRGVGWGAGNGSQKAWILRDPGH